MNRPPPAVRDSAGKDDGVRNEFQLPGAPCAVGADAWKLPAAILEKRERSVPPVEFPAATGRAGRAEWGQRGRGRRPQSNM